MSAELHGKIHRYKLIEFARFVKAKESDSLLRVSKHLLLALAEHLNDKNGQCNPSIERLAKFIERSTSSTIVAMNLLKKLGIVVILKNPKGGRGTSWYGINLLKFEEFSHPVGRTANSPVENTPKYHKQYPSHPVSNIKQSITEDTTHVADRTRILIEPLDKSLIKSLLDESNSEERIQKLNQLAKKYGFEIKNSTPVYQIEDFLIKLTTDLNETKIFDNKEALLNNFLGIKLNALS